MDKCLQIGFIMLKRGANTDSGTFNRTKISGNKKPQPRLVIVLSDFVSP